MVNLLQTDQTSRNGQYLTLSNMPQSETQWTQKMPTNCRKDNKDERYASVTVTYEAKVS